MNNTVLEYSVAMRDGARLYTTVQLPEGASAADRLPIILRRNPYVSKDVNLDSLRAADTHGYAVVEQHCRGCGRSDGDCIPYANERADGLDTLEWIRSLPFYGGEIYLFGISYLSSVHISYLDTNPADVKAAVLCVQDVERYNCVFRNGVSKIGLHGGWSVGMYKKNSIPDSAKSFTQDTFRTLPLSGVSRSVFGEYAPAFEEVWRHPRRDDPFWDTPEGGSEYRRAVSASRIPILLVTGFYDIYTQGLFEMWDSIPPDNRRRCAMVVTPFDHDFNPGTDAPAIPGCEFPGGRLREAAPTYDFDWFDHVRTGRPPRFAREGETVFYTLFENRWHSSPRLETGPRPLRMYLREDRSLGEASSRPGRIDYVYNPFAPASFPGGVCNNFGGLKVQDPPNSRYDIVSFVSRPFESHAVFDGGIECELHVRSTAPDTCFYVRVDLVRDGVPLSLRDDIDTLGHAAPGYRPGDDAVIRFSMAPHSFAVRPGDSLRVDVSSSCMPHFIPHTNRAGLYCDQTGADIATNTILCGVSWVELHARTVQPADVPLPA